MRGKNLLLEGRARFGYLHRVPDFPWDHDPCGYLNSRQMRGWQGASPAAATVFVSRETRTDAWSAGVARFAAVVGLALCLRYLWFLPFTTASMAASIGLGTLAPMLLDRQNDIVATGVTRRHGGRRNKSTRCQASALRPVDTIVGGSASHAMDGLILYFGIGRGTGAMMRDATAQISRGNPTR
jgi:hypothetical protein